MAELDSYDGIIFDYGGVLVFDQSQDAANRLAEIAGLDPPILTERYWRRRLDYDRDALSVSEYWRDVVAEARLTLTEKQIAQLSGVDTESWMQYDPVMWEWLEELRAEGKRIAMLSNMPRDLGIRLQTETNRLSNFDHVTLSFEIRFAKPDKAIYEHALAGVGTARERTLFLDDKIVNVEAARDLGIASIEFTSREEVLSRMRR